MLSSEEQCKEPIELVQSVSSSDDEVVEDITHLQQDDFTSSDVFSDFDIESPQNSCKLRQKRKLNTD